MDIGLVNGFSSANGISAMQSAQTMKEKSEFDNLLSSMISKEKKSTLSSSEISESGRLNGEYQSGFSRTFTNKSDKNAMAKGAAANQANAHIQPKTIDKTSKLYEKSMELESYFVKQMLSAMRKTVTKGMASNDFAGQMYEDMLYDEYSTAMTKSAGFGLADQIYLSLI